MELLDLLRVRLVTVPVSVGIDLKELGGGGQLPKCLKFCPWIKII